MPFSRLATLSALCAALILSACGGGGGSGGGTGAAVNFALQEPGAPAATGNTATDGLNWFNFRRQQLGLSVLARHPKLDLAAQNHSTYQALNDVISHSETSGKPGFTGANLPDRLNAAGYQFVRTHLGYAYGEVISSATTPSGSFAAEGLIAAIYHRFVIFQPMFREVGAGAATSSTGNVYFTTNFTADGLDSGLGNGNFVTYPFAGQQGVPVDFASDSEIPDPVPDRNIVGFPISVHADITSNVTVLTFSVAPRGGATLPVRLLSSATDSETADSVAAIVPLAPLAAGTTYDVQFIGTVSGQPVSRNWSFSTR